MRAQVDFDYYAVKPVGGDIQLGWKTLHEGPDMFWTPRNGGHWVVTRAEDIYDIYRDDERFCTRFVAIPKEEERERKFAPAERDGAEHLDFRKAIMPLFSPKAIALLEEKARTLSVRLIEEMKPRGHCDYVADFAAKLPIAIFLSMMDLPLEDHKLLAPHVDAIARSPDHAAISRAFNTMIDYLDGKIAERAARPGDDALSHLMRSQINGEPISRDDLLSLSANVMFAGLDTVVAGLSFTTRFLAMHPDHRRALAQDPEKIPDAIEEILRRHGIANLARTVRHRTEYKGVVLEPGEMILLPTSLYGLDERRFDDPLSVDFDRSDKRHVAFAVGSHRCVGSHLARMELRVATTEWLKRIPDFEVADPDGVVARSGRLNTLSALPLRWPAAN
ncbi:cytochrome P450 [Rhizorhabdus wittichii]|uniref:Cytochrome P450 n=1 Tax=Rhizorhabdus wittichii TaxID=160791 RepID=A0A975D1Y1_9SPHN|nr:cytochrome P450 [Rhizorhabdus wittichii]QTH21128.1 cytochrome P450 [Rhizorhabdus wittichii]